MKRLLPLVFALLLLLCACGGGKQKTETVSVLVSHESTSYWPEGNDLPSGVAGTWLTVYEYDDQGNQITEKRSTNGELIFTRRWTYDDRGNQTGMVSVDHQGWLPKISTRVKKEYDEAGHLVLEIVYHPWKETQRCLYTYDEQGNMVRMEIRNAGGSTIIQDYTYDENGNCLSTTDHSVEGVSRVTRYAYDVAGNQISWHYYENDVLVEYVQTQYDDQGRKIFSARHNGDGTQIHTWDYRFDEEANTSSIRHTDGSVTTYFYDGQGRRIRVEQRYADGCLSSVETYTYEDIQILANETTTTGGNP